MQRLTIEVNSSIYEHIIFFLQSLPKNLITILHETKENEPMQTKPNYRSLRGVFQHYADPQKQHLESDAWKNHLLEKYKRSMND